MTALSPRLQAIPDVLPLAPEVRGLEVGVGLDSVARTMAARDTFSLVLKHFAEM